VRALRFLHLAVIVALLGCTAVPTGSDGTPSTLPAPTEGARTYTQISAGFVHTCALDQNGAAYCWGNNDYSQLGARSSDHCGGRPCSTDPVAVQGGRQFTFVASGWVHNCGIATDQRTYCWGGGSMDRQGYLGDGHLRRSEVPVPVATDSTFASVTIGDGHTCALTAAGNAFCWGENAWGQLGDGSRTARATPVSVAVGQRFRMLSAGAYHTCGITFANAALCWGDNRWGQLGVGEVPYNSVSAALTTPTPVAGALSFAEVAAGWEHTCALATTGVAYCWGRNEDARQLGDESDVTHRGVPVAVAGSQTFVTLTAGALATCGRTAGNDTWCWGGNYYGGLGTGTVDASGVGSPVRALGGPFTDVAIGQSHTCALAADRRLWCWGDQSAGQF
jgi:alpha-tubulin suppressor-like RCC1 family protein